VERLEFEQEDHMAVDAPSMFAQVIQDHLELKRRNAALEHEMPLERYLTDDPFENHPLFKTEEQARVEDTMDGAQSIVDEPTSLDWPTVEDTFVNVPVFDVAAEEEPEEEQPEPSDENLWSKSRDFDWGD
jgi:hypothetical protein